MSLDTHRQTSASRRGPKPGNGNGWRRFGIAVVALLVVTLPVRAFILEPILVVSTSMRPTLGDGDVIWVSRLAPRLGPVTAGTVVAVQRTPEEAALVKRVVATGGQTVEIYEGALLVDGRMVAEPYADSRQMGGIFYGPALVPVGSVFLLGDNRLVSVDSRDFGPVPLDAVQGTVIGSWAIGTR